MNAMNIEGPSRRRETVGVRELRQNLSVYLDRVKLGETLSVTEYGQVVAVLAPLPAATLTTLERLVGEGRASAPTRSLRSLPPATPGVPGAPRSEDVIAELRDERL
jgi:antitoxin (DNA-binding transcriptional repressor) of toxin-antitoxin stability system